MAKCRMVQDSLSKNYLPYGEACFFATRWIASSQPYSKEDTQKFKKLDHQPLVGKALNSFLPTYVGCTTAGPIPLGFTPMRSRST